MSLWELERECWEQGISLVAGTDEAGAGPLAGPVCAAAVILPREIELAYLDDSKRVTPKRREVLFRQIRERAVAWAVAWAQPAEIDELDILNARILAMDRAVSQLSPPPGLVLVDGNRDHGSRRAITAPHRLVVGGDGRSASIAAASILAKVSRDHLMEELDGEYPGYGFARHKGYPTHAHYEALDRLGPCPIHRASFLKKWRDGRA